MESRQPNRSPFSKETKAWKPKKEGRVQSSVQTGCIHDWMCAWLWVRVCSQTKVRYLVLVLVHGHRQVEVWRHGCRSHRDSLLIPDPQMLGDVQGGGQRGGGCESQKALNPEALPQHLKTHLSVTFQLKTLYPRRADTNRQGFLRQDLRWPVEQRQKCENSSYIHAVSTQNDHIYTGFH